MSASASATATATAATAPSLDLDSMSYQELQQECRRLRIACTGTTQKLERLIRCRQGTIGAVMMKANECEEEEEEEEEKEAVGGKEEPAKKKLKTTTTSQQKRHPGEAAAAGAIVEDLICPITMELPADPVMAEDGRIYERSAIERHFQKGGSNEDGKSKSPMTNAWIGQNLIAAVQVRNIIEKLVEGGTVEDEYVHGWKRRMKEKKEVEELTERAEDGDGEACLELGKLYIRGQRGLVVDETKAKSWFQKAADAGNVTGMAWAGWYCASDMENVQAASLMGMAAGAGSDMACIYFAYWFAQGEYGIPVNKKQAIRLLEKALSGTCSHKSAGPSLMEKAQRMLQELYHADDEDEEGNDGDRNNE